MFSCSEICDSALSAAWADTCPALHAAQVIVVEDENGNIVRETMKDTDTLARYKTMHETLVYLSHLDHDDTEKQMLEKLRLQARCICFQAPCFGELTATQCCSFYSQAMHSCVAPPMNAFV